jgi:hypothetical protein
VSDLQIFAENGAETELGRIAVIHHLLPFFCVLALTWPPVREALP